MSAVMHVYVYVVSSMMELMMQQTSLYKAEAYAASLCSMYNIYMFDTV